MAQTSSSKKVQVLVVGGGFAGFAAVQVLQESKDFVHVTLVSSIDVFEFGPLILRSLVQPSLYCSAIKSYHGNDFSFIHGTVLELKTHEAKLMSHSTNEHMYIRFDFCIWACGTLYSEPVTKLYVTSISERLDMLSNSRKRIEGGNRLLVVGGGLRGVEMAALLTEMCSEMEVEKEIILVSASQKLLFDLPKAARRYAARFLASRGVKLCYEKRVIGVTDKKLRCLDLAKDGAEVTYKGANYVSWNFPRKNQIIAGPLLRGKLISRDELNEDGRILVRTTLQLMHHGNIFAVGDCSSIIGDNYAKRAKTFFTAIEAGRTAARNILTRSFGERSHYSLNIMQKYPEDAFPPGVYPRIYFISLGSKSAVVSAGPFIITGRPAAVMKKILESLALYSLVDISSLRRRFWGFLLRSIYLFCAIANLLFS